MAFPTMTEHQHVQYPVSVPQLIEAFKSLKGACKMYVDRLFNLLKSIACSNRTNLLKSIACSNRIRGNGFKLKEGRFRLEKK